MKKIEAIIKPFKREDVHEALSELAAELCIDGFNITVSEVKGRGRRKEHVEIFRGYEYPIEFLPKIKLELVVDDHLVDPVTQTILKASKTGKIGDGKIFVTPVDEAYDIKLSVPVPEDNAGKSEPEAKGYLARITKKVHGGVPIVEKVNLAR